MTGLWIALGVLVVLGAAYLFAAGGRPWKQLFSDAHLLEMCESLDRVRAAAAERFRVGETTLGEPGSAGEALADPRMCVTSAGLRIVHSVTADASAPGAVSHHVSLSHPAGLLAESGSRFLAALVLARCSVPADGAIVRRSQNYVVHVMFDVRADRHDEFAARTLPVPAPAGLPALRTRLGDLAHALDFAGFQVAAGPPPTAGR